MCVCVCVCVACAKRTDAAARESRAHVACIPRLWQRQSFSLAHLCIPPSPSYCIRILIVIGMYVCGCVCRVRDQYCWF